MSAPGDTGEYTRIAGTLNESGCARCFQKNGNPNFSTLTTARTPSQFYVGRVAFSALGWYQHGPTFTDCQV